MSCHSISLCYKVDGDLLGSGEAALIVSWILSAALFPRLSFLEPYLPQSGLTTWRPQTFQPPAFTPGARVTLANPEAPSVAVSLVRDTHMHQKFGDFDDHLEDVTIDWLRNNACNIVDL
jgi:hypothetical protein